MDTDILIDAGDMDPVAVRCIQEIEERGELAVSVITQMELLTGCRNRREMKSLEEFLHRFEILHLDRPTSSLAVSLMQSFRLSHGLLLADALIAATAIVRNLKLVSKNQKDFRFIPKLKLEPYP